MEYGGKRDAEIVSITVKFRTTRGEERSVTIDARSSDALFWSLDAIDKFALPFYLTTEGFGKAAAIRQEPRNSSPGRGSSSARTRSTACSQSWISRAEIPLRFESADQGRLPTSD